MPEIEISANGKRIYLTSARPLSGLGRRIPGANWLGRPKLWSLPLNYETCQILRKEFGDALAIGPTLWDWAKEEQARRRALAEAAKATDADLPRLAEVAPTLLRAMDSRPYQRVGARFAAQGRQVILGDGVGVGKTIEALGGVIESGEVGPYLVTAPKTALNATWGAQIRRWLPEFEVCILEEGKASRDRMLDELCSRDPRDLERTFVVAHPYAIRSRAWWKCEECGSRTKVKAGVKALECEHDARHSSLLREHNFPQLWGMPNGWGAIIPDESDQTLIRLSGDLTQTRLGMELLRDHAMRDRENGVRIAMSGTPWRSRPKLLWSTLNWLRPGHYTSFWNWVKIYWMLGGYSGYEILDMREDREPQLWESLNGVMIRRTKEDVRDDLPRRNYIGEPLDPKDPDSPIGVYLEMEGAQKKAYSSMAAWGSAEIEGGHLDTVGHLAERTRLKQFAISYGELREDGEFYPARPSGKLDYIEQTLTELGFPDAPSTKVIVVSQFTRVLDFFRKEIERGFKIRSASITGNVSQAARDRVIAEFEDENSDLALLFLNTKAGGSSITLDAATEMIFVDETEIPDDQEQVEGRIDNRNPERRIVPRNYRYLRSLGSIDLGIVATAAERAEESGRLLDGRRGAKYGTAALGGRRG